MTVTCGICGCEINNEWWDTHQEWHTKLTIESECAYCSWHKYTQGSFTCNCTRCHSA